LEGVFKEAKEEIHRWEFHYFVVKDSEENPIVMTFFTSAIMKDDMLATEAVSRKIEELRKTAPRYLTSKVMGMGSLFTEGRQCYIDREHTQWKVALETLLNAVEALNRDAQIRTTMLRDFLAEDDTLKQFFHDKGFIKMDLPDSSKIPHIDWVDSASYVATLSKRSRQHFKKDIAPYTSKFEIAFQGDLSSEELVYAYELYKQVKDRNYGLNTFSYPFELFESMNRHPLWEFLVLRLVDGPYLQTKPMAGIMFCYKNEVRRVYVPSLIGMDYAYSNTYQTYRQLL
jgi:hypothetical protein